MSGLRWGGPGGWVFDLAKLAGAHPRGIRGRGLRAWSSHAPTGSGARCALFPWGRCGRGQATPLRGWVRVVPVGQVRAWASHAPTGLGARWALFPWGRCGRGQATPLRGRVRVVPVGQVRAWASHAPTGLGARWALFPWGRCGRGQATPLRGRVRVVRCSRGAGAGVGKPRPYGVGCALCVVPVGQVRAWSSHAPTGLKVLTPATHTRDAGGYVGLTC